MSTRSTDKLRSTATQETLAAVPGAVRSTVGAATADNDHKPTARISFYGDPLFAMAIASGILFAMLAALMAMG